MAEPIRITEATDPRISDYVNLTDVELRRRTEGDRGLFIAEGVLAIERLLKSDYRPRSFLFTAKAHDRLGAGAAVTGAPVFVAEPDVMRSVVGFDLHRGAVASVVRPDPLPADEVIAGAALLLLVEGVNDHENLGGLFRNAAAFGVDGVLLDPTCADPLYRRSVRVSMGHVLALPFARLRPWITGLHDLGARGVTIVALTPDPAAVAIEQLGTVPAPLAVLVGSEGSGLGEVTMSAVDRHVRIPMAPGVDSLNVATAAAVALHRLSPVPG